MLERSCLAVLFALVACGPEGSVGTVLEGDLGFEVGAVVGLVCPPDPQGQFMKVYVEGVTSASTCDMEHQRQIPTTCEDRQEYLQQVPSVCQGENSAASPNLPMMDYLLQQEAPGGPWTDFDYVPMIVCDDTGNEAVVPMYGNTAVTQLEDDLLQLDFTLSNEEGNALLVAGSVEVPICP